MIEDSAAGKKTGLIRRGYAWMMEKAQGKHALWALAAFAFAEASFFPIPPDVMLLPMMLADRKRAFRLAAWCALWSVIGGLFGYAIGALAWEAIGKPIAAAFHFNVEPYRVLYAANAYWIAIQGLTPIPFKLVTISAGLANVPLLAFVLFACLARSVRFIVIEGLLVHFFGAQAQAILDKYMEAALIVFLVAVVVGIVLVTVVM
ncbi:membrane protein YqaA with SNARE-associated domain [Rhizomicrobium palustre]|uniref:Membrane protein YqaA with SNARE-associated domain n=1 Tax=Rhizomicrobium palustre TaxID=189966 RepID=A0A846MXG7_9PROT|nr:DedA family protein [Rhizomicrobium palustre]NIK87831.1 membrane protein YqaA with SNARE-associated domain [Rhizomicrobium palustre]